MDIIESHAIVIGGGIAGLTVARVLADHFSHVTVLERDFLGRHSPSKGIPQAHHAHGLMRAGANALEGLFPGLRAELALAGSPSLDHGECVSTWFPGGMVPISKSGVDIQLCTRYLLDSCIRRRVLETPGVEICDGLQVTGIQLDAAGRKVIGVYTRTRSKTPVIKHDEKITLMRADFVVDASGRFSAMPQWLEQSGFPATQEYVVDPKVSYSSALFKGPQKAWSALYQLNHVPNSPRGAYAVYTESNEWLITLYGAAGDKPPTEEKGYRAFSSSLGNPLLDQLMEESRMISPIFHYSRTANRRLAYHRMPAWPDRLVVLGDAVCAFNPRYGQGMTLAVLEAIMLGELFTQQVGATTAIGLAKKFQKNLAKRIVFPWLLAISEDLLWETRMRGERGPMLARAFHWYKSRFYDAALKDATLYRVFLAVSHMVCKPTELLRPYVIVRVTIACVRAASFFKRSGTKL